MTTYENAIPAITNELKNANSYLESEKLVVQNVKQQIKEGLPIPAIDENLKKLYAYINKQIQEKSTSRETINFKYAAACLKTLINTPYWHSWIEIA